MNLILAFIFILLQIGFALGMELDDNLVIAPDSLQEQCVRFIINRCHDPKAFNVFVQKFPFVSKDCLNLIENSLDSYQRDSYYRNILRNERMLISRLKPELNFPLSWARSMGFLLSKLDTSPKRITNVHINDDASKIFVVRDGIGTMFETGTGKPIYTLETSFIDKVSITDTYIATAHDSQGLVKIWLRENGKFVKEIFVTKYTKIIPEKKETAIINNIDNTVIVINNVTRETETLVWKETCIKNISLSKDEKQCLIHFLKSDGLYGGRALFWDDTFCLETGKIIATDNHAKKKLSQATRAIVL